MQIRIWSKKVVSVLRYFQLHPYVTLFGVTGDIDNLGVYVAMHGRATAEILVDTYNRAIGSTYYDYLQSRPHEFFETCFLPAGEEIFILGTAADGKAAETMFEYIKTANIAAVLAENTPLNIGQTDITFGCSTFERDSLIPQIEHLLSVIEKEDFGGANAAYVEVLSEIRAQLAIQLDLGKFSSLGTTENDVKALRNIVYLKTLQYKSETRALLARVGAELQAPSGKMRSLVNAIGERYGLQNTDADQLFKTLLGLLS